MHAELPLECWKEGGVDGRELRARSDHWLGQQGRLTTPMHLAPGATHYTPVTWDRALDIAAENLWTINISEPPPFLVASARTVLHESGAVALRLIGEDRAVVRSAEHVPIRPDERLPM